MSSSSTAALFLERLGAILRIELVGVERKLE
jgi:hypothetical protein